VCQAGACPATDYCTDPNLYECNEGCACAKSINNVTVCSSFEGAEDCVNCTSDAQCGAGKVCIPQDDTFCQTCTGNTGFCVPNNCPVSAGLSAAANSQTPAIFASKQQAQQRSKGQAKQGHQRHHSRSTKRQAKKKGNHRR
jgi:Cys-rich repeat protein